MIGATIFTCSQEVFVLVVSPMSSNSMRMACLHRQDTYRVLKSDPFACNANL